MISFHLLYFNYSCYTACRPCVIPFHCISFHSTAVSRAIPFVQSHLNSLTFIKLISLQFMFRLVPPVQSFHSSLTLHFVQLTHSLHSFSTVLIHWFHCFLIHHSFKHSLIQQHGKQGEWLQLIDLISVNLTAVARRGHAMGQFINSLRVHSLYSFNSSLFHWNS